MNWKKTEEFYTAEGLPYLSEEDKHKLREARQPVPAFSYQKKPDQLDLERWELKVKDRNGYRQRVNDKVVYPTTRVIQAKRIRTLEGEYLCSFVELMGIDNIGNRVPMTWQNPEVYVKPEFTKELRGGRDADAVVVSIREDERVYTLNYTPENVDKLLENQNTRVISFSVAEDLGQGPISPREVRRFEDFRNKPFDELYTPIPEVRDADRAAAGTAGPRARPSRQ